MLQDAVNTESYAKYKQVQRGGAPPAADQPARPAGLQDRPQRRSPSTRSNSITELRKRLVAPGISLGALGPEAHETLSIAMNRIGAKSDSGEGGEDPARYKPRAQRRQRLVGHQAGGVGPLRRHGGVSQQLPRARDQGRPGRQARRGRPAARLQGERDDRPPAPFDARRDADQPAAAPRHLFDRGSGAAHLRPEADQSRGARDGEAGGALGHRHHRGRRRQGQGRRDPDVGP